MAHKLSLWAAMLVNINIMLGSGIFINTVLLARSAGGLGALVYILVGLLVLPLIVVVAELLKIHEGGTFYEFGRTIHPLVGFISSWSYFTAKLASCALGVHVCITLLQKMFIGTWFSYQNPLVLDSLVILFFVFLNLYNVRIGRSIQYGFICLKLIPIFMIIGTALFWFNKSYYSLATLQFDGIISSIPFVLFAFGGFEASCSLSRSIENPQKNGPRAVIGSYLIVLTLLCAYQIAAYGIFGPSLALFDSFRDVFPALAEMIGSIHTQELLKASMLIGIAASSLGASYGIMYSNVWNLYTLASHNHVVGKPFLMRLNKQNIPLICVVIEGLIALCYIWFTVGNQVPLQQISALGSTVAYAISAFAFTLHALFITQTKRIWGVLSLLSCTVFFIAAFRNGIIFGYMPYLIFSIIVLFGICMFWWQKE